MIGRHCRIIGNEFKDILVLFVRPYSKTLALLESILITRYEVIFLQARTNTIREKNILTNVKTFWVYVRLSLFIMTIVKLSKRNHSERKCFSIFKRANRPARFPDEVGARPVDV